MRKISLLIFSLVLFGCGKDMPTNDNKFSFPIVNMRGLTAKALQGDLEAQYRLGSNYCCGARKNDEVLATKWLCMAARRGHIEAQKKVGWVYSRKAVRAIRKKEDYRFSSHNNMIALTWYNIAFKNGDETVAPFIREISMYMSWKDAQRADYYIGEYPNIPCEIRS